MNGFYIEVSNGLLQGHRKRMGSAVWEFMWLLDKITKIDDEGTGWILGGKPIKLSDLADDLEIAQNHISENLNKLRKQGYIETKRTPYGLIIKVARAKKRFNQKVKSDFTKRSNHPYEKVKSNKTSHKTRQLDKRKGLKKFSSIKDLQSEDLLEIATRYKVSIGFVRLQFESLKNYCESSGRKYKNYKAALRNFVLRARKDSDRIVKPKAVVQKDYTLSPEEREKGRAKIDSMRKGLIKEIRSPE